MRIFDYLESQEFDKIMDRVCYWVIWFALVYMAIQIGRWLI